CGCRRRWGAPELRRSARHVRRLPPAGGSGGRPASLVAWTPCGCAGSRLVTSGITSTPSSRFRTDWWWPWGGTARARRTCSRRRRDVRRLVRSVFFSPGDLDIVQGQPDVRRAFCDEAVSVLWPHREPEVAAYEKALRQRNRLLKDWEGRGAPPGLDAWDAELV